ncbi:MAG: T9SS type A sorting domain-containing protein [Saprospiraceae bacterium]|nr:T9SS type A sorting domain-containing protein [Saprospiraceae bacterium]
MEFYPIRVAPNPISDISQIYLPESISKDSKLIEIYSLQAGVLEKFWTNENTIQVNKKDKKPGMYFLKITTNSNQTFSTKFLIQ